MINTDWIRTRGEEVIAKVHCHLCGREVCQPGSSNLCILDNSSCPRNWGKFSKFILVCFRRCFFPSYLLILDWPCLTLICFVCRKLFITLCRNCLNSWFAIAYSSVFNCFPLIFLAKCLLLGRYSPLPEYLLSFISGLATSLLLSDPVWSWS